METISAIWSVSWRHQMETVSALLAICAGNSPVTGEFPAQRPVTRNFGVFFDMHLNKRLSKQSWYWWFETPSRSSWRHCNGHSSEIRRLWDPRMSVQSTQDIHHLSIQRQWCEFLYQLLKRISQRCIRLEIFVLRSTTSHTKICCVTILKVIYNWWILSTCNSVCKRWNERQTPPYELTSRARVSHICVNKLTTFGSDDGLSPGRCQATIWTNDEIL